MLKIFVCLKCDWEWASRLPEKPKYCARCKRVNWDQPKRVREQAKADQHLRGPGRPRRYDIDKLALGQSMVIPWVIGPDGFADPASARSANRSVAQEEQRYNKKFLREGTTRGLKVTRIA